MLEVAWIKEFRVVSFGLWQNQRVLGGWQSGVVPFLTKSTRLMCHNCGSSCIWKNIWRMLEILMQARTALRWRRQRFWNPASSTQAHIEQAPLFLPTLGR